MVVHYCCLVVVDMHHKVDWRMWVVVDNKGRSYEVLEAVVAVVVVVVGKS